MTVARMLDIRALPTHTGRPEGGGDVNENDHPKGALLFMLVYLALLAFLWTNLYLKLWTR